MAKDTGYFCDCGGKIVDEGQSKYGYVSVLESTEVWRCEKCGKEHLPVIAEMMHFVESTKRGRQ